MKATKRILAILIIVLSSMMNAYCQNAKEVMQIVDNMLQLDGNGLNFIFEEGVVHYKGGNTENGKLKLQIGMSYNSLGTIQLISETKMKPVVIYPSDVEFIEIGNVKFYPIQIKDDKGSYSLFAASLSKNIDDKMVMFRLYKSEYSQQTPGKIVLLKDLCVITARQDKSVILGAIGGTLGITPFHKYMSKMVDDCEALANKIKDKEDGYKVSLIDLKNINQDVYFKVLEEYNTCK